MAQFEATIPSGQITGTLTDFPAYVDLANLPAAFWSTVSSGGGDIRVYSGDGATEYAREVVSCDTGTETGELWIKIPSAATGSEVIIDVDGIRSDYAVTDTYGRNAVWSDYAGVWHLGESSGNAIDSTGNNTLTDNNTVGAAAGQIDGARDFENSNSEYLNITDAAQTGLDITGAFTLQSWVNPETLPANAVVLSKYNTTTNQRSYELVIEGSTNVSLNVSKNGGATSRNVDVAYTLSTSQWAQITALYNTSNWTYLLYVDGSFVNSQQASLTIDSIFDGSADFAIGARTSTTPGLFFDGLLDEVRVREILLTADWIAAEYNNQSNNAAFWGTWTEVTVPAISSNFFLFF